MAIFSWYNDCMNELTPEVKLAFQGYGQNQLNNAFIDACRGGELGIVQYLLTGSDLLKYADIHADNDRGFRLACLNGHVDVIRYLLTALELKEDADIHVMKDYAFVWACRNGHLNVVCYLLTSPELTDHADIHAKNDLGFQWACEYGHLDIICYLLSLNNDQAIYFQKTKYNLDWAMKDNRHWIKKRLAKAFKVNKLQKNHKMVKAMVFSLYKNDMMEYVENMSKIEQYCKEHRINFAEWKKEMIKEDANINSQTTELFL